MKKLSEIGTQRWRSYYTEKGGWHDLEITYTAEERRELVRLAYEAGQDNASYTLLENRLQVPAYKFLEEQGL